MKHILPYLSIAAYIIHIVKASGAFLYAP